MKSVSALVKPTRRKTGEMRKHPQILKGSFLKEKTLNSTIFRSANRVAFRTLFFNDIATF